MEDKRSLIYIYHFCFFYLLDQREFLKKSIEYWALHQ